MMELSVVIFFVVHTLVLSIKTAFNLVNIHLLCLLGFFFGGGRLKSYIFTPGADPGFQVRGGAHLKKLRRAEGGSKIVGVFRVKNHDFTEKNLNFSNFRGAPLPPGSAPVPRLFCKYLLTFMVEEPMEIE